MATITVDRSVSTIVPLQFPKEYYYIDDSVSLRHHEDTCIYVCPYCDSIYDVYHSNCKNCGAPLQMKPISRY